MGPGGNELGGAVEGFRASQQDYRANRQDSRAQTRSNQVLDDSAYQRQRRETVDKRADGEYAQQQDGRQRYRDVTSAMQQWQTTGDVQPLIDVQNQYAPIPNATYNLQRGEDGSYTSVVDVNGKQHRKNMSEDDLGASMIQLGQGDTLRQVQAMIDANKKAAATRSSREFDIKKLDREYMHRKDIANIKANKKTGSSSKGYKVSPDTKYFYKLAADRNGTKFDTGFSFEEGKNDKAGFQAVVAETIWKKNGSVNGEQNTAFAKGVNTFNAIDSKINEVLDGKGLTGAEREKAYSQTMYNAVLKFAQPGSKTVPNRGDTAIPQNAVKKLKANPGMASAFDEKYGKGTSQKYIGSKKRGISLSALRKQGGKSIEKKLKKYRAPMPRFANTAEGKGKQADYDKSLKALTQRAEQAAKTDKLHEFSRNELRLVLNGKLSKTTQQAVLELLN